MQTGSLGKLFSGVKIIPNHPHFPGFPPVHALKQHWARQVMEVLEPQFFSCLRSLPSLKLTAKAPENRPKPNRKVVFQASIFRGYISVRDGKLDIQ